MPNVLERWPKGPYYLLVNGRIDAPVVAEVNEKGFGTFGAAMNEARRILGAVRQEYAATGRKSRVERFYGTQFCLIELVPGAPALLDISITHVREDEP